MTHIIAAGSLLGVAFNRDKSSFPVGKVDLLHLYPLDFEEFLWAVNGEALAEKIRGCYTNNNPLSAMLHDMALNLYKEYLIVGGMPAVVNEYCKSQRLLDAANVQAQIVDAYIADMAKYAAPVETTKIMAAYQDFSSFKLYMGDVGLLTLKSGMPAHNILTPIEANNTFIGAIVENYVACQLRVHWSELYYWDSAHTAEIDFIIQDQDKIIPVEVKSSGHTRSRSLSVYKEKYAPPYAIKISAKNFGFENNIKSVPLYAVFCIA